MLGANWKHGQNINPDDFANIFGGMGGGGTRMRTNMGGNANFSDVLNDILGGFMSGGGGRAASGASPFGPGPTDPFGDREPFWRTPPGTDGKPAKSGGKPGDVETELSISLEDAYRGVTRSMTFNRTDGSGAPRTKTYELKIPAGIRDGQKMRLKGEGSQTSRGGRGDIMIKINVQPHPRFKLDKDHLEMELPLAPWEAVLGCTASVETLSGPVDLKVPSGIQAGKKLRVRGKGWPVKGGSAGDLFLRVAIKVPEHVSQQERELFEKLANISKFKPRG
jgi:curved DNA-binding protein